ncbi:MAG: hypothetical protein C4525_11480 [Desulfarculus sp.]|jgi:DMSO/TMAO reductase YedYZ molybdopterin-dependent catalytic subunit|nr:MAG: hypothetical protein C4525_11480 [Desulfarculus sp.]
MQAQEKIKLASEYTKLLRNLLSEGQDLPILSYRPPIETRQYGIIISREIYLSKIDSFVTPTNDFFLRSHFPYPQKVILNQWKLSLRGCFPQEVDLSLEELFSFDHTTQVVMIECTGNSHSTTKDMKEHLTFQKILRLLDPSQWKSILAFIRGGQRHGMLSTGLYTGVRLHDVLKKYSPRPEARYLVFRGKDRGYDNLAHRLKGQKHHYERSFPIEELLQYDPLLCFELNGKPLSPEQGYPIRLIIPGVYGAEHVKWLEGIYAFQEEFHGYFMDNYYANIVEQEQDGNLIQVSVPVHALGPKSLVFSVKKLKDKLRFLGIAWGGIHPLSAVKVSLDGGRSWQDSELVCEAIDLSWTFWKYEVPLAGSNDYVLMPRAFCAHGQCQPLTQPDHLFYGNNAVIPAQVSIKP